MAWTSDFYIHIRFKNFATHAVYIVLEIKLEFQYVLEDNTVIRESGSHCEKTLYTKV